MLFNTLNQAVELGWDFYLPVIIFVVLAALAVPVWASIGVAAITMLLIVVVPVALLQSRAGNMQSGNSAGASR